MLQQKPVHYWKNGKDVVLMVIYPTSIEAVISNVCKMPYRWEASEEEQEKLVET